MTTSRVTYELQPQEEVLLQGECLAHIGPMTFPGYVTLTTLKLSFRPTEFNRKIGVRPWSYDIEAVDGASFSEHKGVLEVRSAGVSRRLSGGGAKALYDLLAPLLNAEHSRPRGERVLISAAAEMEMNEFISARGELMVTTSRLRFFPARLESLMWPSARVDIPVGDVVSFGLVGLRRHLEIETQGRALRFLGAVVPDLYGALEALREHRDDPRCPAELVVLPVSLRREPVFHPGTLVCTRKKVTLVSTQPLDALAGVPGVLALATRDVTRIQLGGLLDRWVEVHTAEDHLRLGNPDPARLFETLSTLLARHLDGPAWCGHRPEPEVWGPRSPALLKVAPPPSLLPPPPPPAINAAIEAELATWRQRFRLPTLLTLFSPAVYVSETDEAIPGWLLSGDETLIWLPRGGKPLRIVLDGTPVLRRDSPAGEVEVQPGRGRTHRWLLVSDTFRAALRDVLERPPRRPPSGARPTPSEPKHWGQNRRQTYRVTVPAGVEVRVQLWVQSEGELTPLTAEFVDFSLHGFQIRLSEALSAETLLRADVDADGHVESLVAHQVHCHVQPGERSWIAAYCFAGNWGDVEAATHYEWLALQQRIKKKRREEEPD